MIPTPADRGLAATIVATTRAPSAANIIAADVDDTARWEFAMLLIAVARNAGWTPSGTPSPNP